MLPLAELSWLAAALFNVGVDLHSSGHFAAAVTPLQAAMAAAAAACAAGAGAAPQEAALRCQDVTKKCLALADAQQRRGDRGAALCTLADGVTLGAQLGGGGSGHWQPLLPASVRTQLGATEAAAQPKGGRGKKLAATAEAQPAPLAALVQARGGGRLPPGALVAVAECELQAWAAASNDSPLAAASCGAVCDRLLTALFPAESSPVEHAGTLLMIHKLGLAEEVAIRIGAAPLDRAIALLSTSQSVGPAAGAVLARARAAAALAAGRQRVCRGMDDQRQQRQASHAAASTSGPGGTPQAPAPDPPAGPADAVALSSVLALAEAAVAEYRALASELAEGGGQGEAASGAEAALLEALDLGCMLGVQGARRPARLPACLHQGLPLPVLKKAGLPNH